MCIVMYQLYCCFIEKKHICKVLRMPAVLPVSLLGSETYLGTQNHLYLRAIIFPDTVLNDTITSLNTQ